MVFFIEGLMIGLFWPVIKWLTYDFIKAIARGVYNACRVILFGELKEGHTRWGAVKWLPKVAWRESIAYLKWEWLNGCKLSR